MPKILHRALIELIEALGYTKDESIAGVCHGFTIRWLEAKFLQNKKQFIDRVNRILQDETALQKIAEFKTLLAQEKTKNTKIDLSEDDTEKSISQEKPLLDIKLTSELQFFLQLLGIDTLAFLDSLMLFHSPEKFDHIFPCAHFNQEDYERISFLASSNAIQERGGIIRVHSQPGMYSQNELIDFFQRIQQTIDGLGDNAPPVIGFLLNSVNHGIGMAYDTKLKQWSIMDINQWPARRAQDITNQFSILQPIIFQAFNFDDLKNPYVTFDTAILVLGDDVKQWPQLETAFDGRYAVTEDISQRQGFSNLVKIATWHNHPEIILAAHQYHYNLNEPFSNDTNTDITPLILACQKSSKKVIKALHECGVDFNKPNLKGLRPAAAITGSMEILELLAKYGANLNRMNNEEISPLEAAIEAHNAAAWVPVFKAYHVNLNEPNSIGNTPLLTAVKNNDLPCVKALLTAGVDLNGPDKLGNTPLYYATQNNYLDCLRALLTAGANVNVPDEFGKTPLHYATQNKYLNGVIALLNANADVNLTDNDGNTSLHEAAENGDADILVELLTRPIDINRPNKQGKTALHLAVNNNHERASLLLIQYGANVNLQDKNGNSPLLEALIFHRKLNITIALINAGADVNCKNRQGNAGLHVVLEDGNLQLQLMRTLLEHGADANQTTANGEHPVCIAIKYSSSNEKLLELLKYDVDLLTQTPSGKIPLFEALKYRHSGSDKLIILYQCNKFSQFLGGALMHNNTKLIMGFLLLTGLAYLYSQPATQSITGFFKAAKPTDNLSSETLTKNFGVVKK